MQLKPKEKKIKLKIKGMNKEISLEQFQKIKALDKKISKIKMEKPQGF